MLGKIQPFIPTLWQSAAIFFPTLRFTSLIEQSKNKVSWSGPHLIHCWGIVLLQFVYELVITPWILVNDKSAKMNNMPPPFTRMKWNKLNSFMHTLHQSTVVQRKKEVGWWTTSITFLSTMHLALLSIGVVFKSCMDAMSSSRLLSERLWKKYIYVRLLVIWKCWLELTERYRMQSPFGNNLSLHKNTLNSPVRFPFSSRKWVNFPKHVQK